MSNATQIYEHLCSGKPLEVELLNPSPTYSSRSKVFYLRFDLNDEELWRAMRALERKGLRMKGLLWILPDDEGASEQGQIEPESLETDNDENNGSRETRLNARETRSKSEIGITTRADEEKRSTSQQNRKCPSESKRAKKEPKPERTLDQVINGKAWSLLLHAGPNGNGRGFASCPDVREVIQDLPGDDAHERLRGAYGVPHLYLIGEEHAVTLFHESSPARVMIADAWRDAAQWKGKTDE